MSKKLISITVIMIMLFGVFGLAGCGNSKHKIYEEGYFQYIIVGENSSFPQKGENGVVAIVGFTESGKEQKIIDFPMEIDGKVVTRIGYRDEGFSHNNSHHVYSEKLRKIYVHDNIKDIVYFDGSEVAMMVCSINSDMIDSYGMIDTYGFFKIIYIYKTVFDQTNHNSNVFPANIVFVNNFLAHDSDNYYRLDNIEVGEKISIPPIPNRSGYEFAGWYTEAACINAWDFDIEPSISANTEFRLYAKWRAI